MNDDFVTYEFALKLKEKGFRMPCIAHYCCLDGNILKFNITTDCIRGSNVKCLNGENNIYTDAPIISQVLKWLRNTHNLHVETYPCGLGMWKFLVTNIITLEERALCDKYTSSEQAEIAGISYVLDNLI